MNLDKADMQAVIDQAKRGGVTKQAFKDSVKGLASNKDRMRGKTNASRHQKGQDLNDLIDLLWDDERPAREVITKIKKEWRATWIRLVLQTLGALAFIIGLSVLLGMMGEL